MTMILPSREKGGGSTRMITYHMNISALLIFKVLKEKSSFNEMHVAYDIKITVKHNMPITVYVSSVCELLNGCTLSPLPNMFKAFY